MAFLTSAIVPSILQGIITTAVRGATETAQTKTATMVPRAEVAQLAEAIAAQIMANPEAVNQFNLEPAHQSRVVQGAGLAAIMSAVSVVLSFVWPDQDWTALSTALITLAGAGWALYGRLASKLRPTGA